MRERAVRDVREDILSASFDYLVKNGLDSVSLRELCKSTGISMGSIYYWFDSKDELFIDSAVYGLHKVADDIFDYAFRSMGDLKQFFNNCLGEISKYKMQLRFIYQTAASPLYGEHLRKKALDLNLSYDRYAKTLSELINYSADELTPLVYIFIATVLDYIIWDDYAKAKIQLDYIYSVLEKTPVNMQK